MKNLCLLVMLVFLFFGCEEEPTVVEKIAQANGLEHFENVEEINYTFNVKINDSLRTSRTWRWKPKTNLVTLTTPETTLTYNHATEAAANAETDQKFINDQYWLLFPFHLQWDKMEYEHFPEALAPISGEEMQQVTITYPPKAGYTPGDVYEVYFDDDHMIREWVYKAGGSDINPFATTWENYEDHKGIKIAKSHSNKDGSFELYFSGVSVK